MQHTAEADLAVRTVLRGTGDTESFVGGHRIDRTEEREDYLRA